jgi:hypothetical protein
MKTKPFPASATVRLLALGLASLGTASLLNAGFAANEVFLPAVGRVPGAAGSQFYTTVWVTNLSATTPITFDFQFLETGQANPAPHTFSDALAAGQTKLYEDIVLSRLGLTNANGAGRILASGEIFASARVYDQAPGADLGNTQGLFFAGVPASFAIGSGESASIQGVNQGDGENFRYNFAMVETTGAPATLHVALLDDLGAVLGSHDYSLLAFEHLQANVTDILPSVSTLDARLQASVTAGSGRVLVAGAQIANESQDSSGFEMSFRDSLITSAGVTSLNGLTGDLTLAAGQNVTITPSAGTLTISSGAGLLLPFTGTATLTTGFGLGVTTVGGGGGLSGSGSPGVYGTSGSNTGVLGESGSGGGGTASYGVVGRSLAANGTGVYGTAQNGSAAYGVWGESSSGWAGYFSGNVHVTGVLTRAYSSGTANPAAPTAYAYIDAPGTLDHGTPNVSSSWDPTNHWYAISIAGVSYTPGNFATVVTPGGTSATVATAAASGGQLIVTIRDLTGAAVQSDFQFVTFEPASMSPTESAAAK